MRPSRRLVMAFTLFRLCSRQIYDELDWSSLRIRSTCSEEFIRARLLTLDFVMAHPAANYLQTSSEKQAFFTEKMGLPTTILPGKVYSGIPSLECKLRYFTDRFPIFLESQDAAQSGLQSPVFVYCDAYEKGLDAFKTHLQRYQPLFKRLARFRYMYASPQPRRFARARRLFDSLMPKHTQVDTRELLYYFRIARLWEIGETAELTRQDREFLRAGDQKFRCEPFTSIYRKWFWHEFGETELRTLLGSVAPPQNYSFDTYYLPESYGIFRHQSMAPSRTMHRTIQETRWSADGSVFDSVDEGWESP